MNSCVISAMERECTSDSIFRLKTKLGKGNRQQATRLRKRKTGKGWQQMVRRMLNATGMKTARN